MKKNSSRFVSALAQPNQTDYANLTTGALITGRSSECATSRRPQTLIDGD